MLRRLLIFLLIFCAAISTEAQTLKAYKKAGEKSMKAKDYYSAMEYFRLALEKSPEDSQLQFLTAEAARKFQAYDLAKDLYTKVLAEEKSNGKARFYLALIKKGEGEYEAAIADFKLFLQAKGQEQTQLEQAQKEIENCRWAIAELANAKELKVQHLGKKINTPYSEFAPILIGDTLYYSSYRYENRAEKVSPRRKISKVLYSIKSAKGRPLPRNFNDKEKNTAYAALNFKGDRIYYSICSYKTDEIDIQCQLYYRKKDKRKRWGKPVALSDDINLAGYTATQPHIAYDSTRSAEVLYFVSDRPEGKGGLDIWYTVLKKNGQAGKVENLALINTPDDEMSPFFLPKSKTLFYSSNSSPGFGGFDVYQATQKKDGSWTAKINLGVPINSSYNDVYYSINADSTVAHLSSNREGSLHLDRRLKSCCNDIFRINFPTPKIQTEPKDSTDIVDLPPKIDSLIVEREVPIPVVTTNVPFEPTTLEDFLPLALYFDNDEPDRRTRRTTTRKTYGQTFDRYYAQKSTYLREYTDGLNEEKRWEAEDLLEGFFESEVRRNAELLNRFSEILLRRLEQGESIEIFMKGFTSPRANSDYNLTLGQRRISSVRNHFFQYLNGIFVPYLNGGQLKITERSFGETSADLSVSADLADRRNSIYSIGAAKERRVEIMEINATK